MRLKKFKAFIAVSFFSKILLCSHMRKQFEKESSIKDDWVNIKNKITNDQGKKKPDDYFLNGYDFGKNQMGEPILVPRLEKK